jgi:hypothetical protein
MSADASTPAGPGWRDRLAQLGRLGLIVYLSTTCVSMVSFLCLLHFGLGERLAWLDEHLPDGSGTIVGAYALTKLIQVPRIAFTVAFTPMLARWLGRETPPRAGTAG